MGLTIETAAGVAKRPSGARLASELASQPGATPRTSPARCSPHRVPPPSPPAGLHGQEDAPQEPGSRASGRPSAPDAPPTRCHGRPRPRGHVAATPSFRALTPAAPIPREGVGAPVAGNRSAHLWLEDSRRPFPLPSGGSFPAGLRSIHRWPPETPLASEKTTESWVGARPLSCDCGPCRAEKPPPCATPLCAFPELSSEWFC